MDENQIYALMREDRQENARLRHKIKVMHEKIETLRGDPTARANERRSERLQNMRQDFRKRLFEILAGGPVTQTEIARKTSNGLRSHERRSFLAEMVEEGIIRKERVRRCESQGNKANVYSLVAPQDGPESFKITLRISLAPYEWATAQEISQRIELHKYADQQLLQELERMAKDGEIEFKDKAFRDRKVRRYRRIEED